MKDKNVLITGGAGAIGSNLTRELLKLGHKVVVFDDLSSGHRSFVPKEVTFVKGSVTKSSDLRRLFEKYRPEYVFHLAALFANQNSVDHPLRDISVNGEGTLRIMQFAKRYGVKKVVYTSSSCVYGNMNGAVKEDKSIYDLDTPYAITKLLGEHYCQFFHNFYGMDVAIVRIFNTYGPYELSGRYRNVIPNFISLAIEGKPLTLTGDGSETRDFNYVGDTVSGIVKAMFSDTKEKNVFNIGSGIQTTIKDLAIRINEITNNKSGVIFLPRRGWDRVGRRCADIRLATDVLGYHPRTKLERGLRHTYEWISRNAQK